jgi:hypothetical protein
MFNSNPVLDRLEMPLASENDSEYSMGSKSFFNKRNPVRGHSTVNADDYS